MSEEKKDDIFALVKENGLPAYPKWVGEVIVKNPEEHKKVLEANKVEAKPEAKAPDWSKK